jgi:hypothetical protein
MPNQNVRRNMRVSWTAWISMLAGIFSLSRGFPTSGRTDKDGSMKTHRAEVEMDGDLEQWSPKVYRDLMDNMDVMSGEGSIDPPEIGANEPELPSNMCAMHNAEGGSVDGTEGIS